MPTLKDLVGRAMHGSALAVTQLHAMMPAMIHERFFEANYINPAPNSANTRIVSVTVPHGLLGVLEGILVLTATRVDFDSLVFQVRVNGAPILGYDSLQGPMGDTITGPYPVFVPLNSQSVVDVVVRNPTLGSFVFATGALLGRFFPDTLPHELHALAATRGGG